MTPETLLCRIADMERLTPTSDDLKYLAPDEADRLAQRLQVVNCELWIIRRELTNIIVSADALQEAKSLLAPIPERIY